MNRLVTSLGILTAGMTIGWTSNVKAEVTLCNRFEQPIYIAFSQQKADRSPTAVIVKGWWYAKPGQCQVVFANNLNNGENYGYYAISADKQRTWNGDNNSLDVCISDRGFDLMTATKAQCTAPNYPVKFQSIDTKNRQSVNFEIKS